MLYGTGGREAAWKRLSDGWDLIVIGGGITGAGVMREAVRAGLRVLLLEQNDFASGTSSRSSKLVHGGLRYLNNLQLRMTWRAVHERDLLLREGRGLIEPLPFIMPTYETGRLPGWMLEIGLYIYGWMDGRWRIHQGYDPQAVQVLSPGLAGDHLTGAFRFYDAQTDDARLVLRVIREGVKDGHGVALNYARVETLVRDEDGQVIGVRVRDRETRRVYEARAAAVINATGAWADDLRVQVGGQPSIRRLRGSHLIFRQDRLPVFQAISFAHPDDGRPVFLFPWQGVTLVGTTDMDHHSSLDQEPAISQEEVAYLLRAVRSYFPSYGLSERDVMTTFSGIRPVIHHGEMIAPSRESREHAIWHENGLLTVTGGKLTTFRCMALDALKRLRNRLPQLAMLGDKVSALDPLPELPSLPLGLPADEVLRLAARYGADILAMAGQVSAGERRRINGLPIRWLELRWAARHEAVCHLDDLLLRRVRLGLLVADGGARYLPRIRQLVQGELGWDNACWEQEVADYLERWRSHYGTPADLASYRLAPAA